ncbi:MAG: DNA polymerase III subunit delta [Deltaproteobacteria bacterium]
MKNDNVYFLWGEEAYLIEWEIKAIRQRMQEASGEEVELIMLDGDDLSPGGLRGNLEYSSLFAGQRLVVIKRPPWLGKSRRKVAKADEFKQVLGDYLKEVHEGQIVVLTSAEHDGSNGIVKLLDKQATAVQFKTAAPQYISKWAADEFKARGCNAAADAVGMLARSGQDLYYLENLIEKLSLMYSGEKITAADVERELENKEEIKVFKLTDALLNRNLTASFAAYYQLREQGEHPLLFLYMIVRQFISLGKAKYYQEKGYGKAEIASATGMKDFTVQKMMGCARQFSWAELRDLFELFLQLDITMKSSSQDDNMLMESMIVEICGK